MRAKLPTTLISTLSHTRSQHLPFKTLLPPRCLKAPKSSTRTLTTTLALLKKGGKQDSKRTVSLNASKAHSASPTIDAFDFTDYTTAIEHAHEHLKSELAKIKAGGRNAEELEGLRIVLGKAGGDVAVSGDGSRGKGKKGGEGKADRDRGSVKLGDVASVVARGRNVGVMVGEKDVRY